MCEPAAAAAATATAAAATATAAAAAAAAACDCQQPSQRLLQWGQTRPADADAHSRKTTYI